MFNVTKIRATNGAGKSFYANHLSANDYYSESEKIVGHWRGILSFDFDLVSKEVDMEAWNQSGNRWEVDSKACDEWSEVF